MGGGGQVQAPLNLLAIVYPTLPPLNAIITTPPPQSGPNLYALPPTRMVQPTFIVVYDPLKN